MSGSANRAPTSAKPPSASLLLPETSSMLVGADAWVRPMLYAIAVDARATGNAVAW